MACSAGSTCVNNVCVKTGPLRVSLWWSRPGDLDLRVLTPAGREINYINRTDGSGAMDRDDTRGNGPENIYWQSLPAPGTYTVCVDSRLRGSRGAPPVADFTVAVVLPNGQTQTYTGRRMGTQVANACRSGGSTFVTSFTVAGGMVPPPVPYPTPNPTPYPTPYPTPPPPTGGTIFGQPTNFNGSVQGTIYNLPINTQGLPSDWSRLQQAGNIYADRWDIAPRSFDQGFPGVTNRFEWFAIRYVGQFQITTPGTYSFRSLSDDGSRFYVDGRLVVNNDGTHAPQSAQGSVNLSAGLHNLELQYFQGPQYQIALQLFVTPPGRPEQIFVTRGL